MAILRKTNKEQYTTIPQGLLRDERLSLKDIGLLVSMLALPDNWKFSENGLEAIFKNDGQASIRTGLKRLEEAGYLHRERERGADGRISAVTWYLYDTPQIDKPRLENPSVAKPSLENPPQSNTKQSNTKESITEESNTNKSITKKILSSEFEKLWAMYPRKQGGKDKTFGYYERARKNGTTYEEVEQGIRAYKEYLRLSGTGDKYIKMASTFFSQKGWQDDYTVAQPKTNPNVGWDEATQQGLRSIFGGN